MSHRDVGDKMEKSLFPQLHPEVITAIQRALEEDIGSGDLTTEAIVPPQATMWGDIIAKQDGVIAGLEVAEAVYKMLDEAVQFQPYVVDGEFVQRGQKVARLYGPARSLLTAERTALNFLGRMSGIATLTRQYVEAIAATRAVLLDTRKTAPGLRIVDKMAVRYGGGQNHRLGLYDMVLIKDNHIDFDGSITQAVQLVRAYAPHAEIEVEVRTLAELQEALEAKVSRILLDNMSLDTMRAAVELVAGRAKLEASGNVTLENVRAIAETGVDFISCGALTHSAKVFDLSFEYGGSENDGAGSAGNV